MLQKIVVNNLIDTHQDTLAMRHWQVRQFEILANSINLWQKIIKLMG